MDADPRTLSIVSLISQSALLGVLAGGFILMLFVFAYSRSRLHLTALFFNAAAIFFVVTEGMILFAYLTGQPGIGRQFHRLQALSIASIVVLIPAFVETTGGLAPLWKIINRAVFVLTIAFTAFLAVVAFAAPDLFVSVDRAISAGSALNTRWAEARGETGALYPLRDAVVLPLLFYMLAALTYRIIARRELRYTILPVAGLLVVILTGLTDLLYVYRTVAALRFMRNIPSLTTFGITVFVVLTLISVLRRSRDETREIENARKIESLGALAGGIAHDFNNLLTAISGYVSLACEKTAAGSEERELLDGAQAAADRARELAGTLLALSRGGEPKKEPISLRPLVEGAGAFVPPGANVELALTIDPDLKNIRADKAQIARLLQNLVVNGCQAMGGGGRLEIEVANAAGGAPAGGLSPGAYVRLVVRDTGAGIRKSDLERVFDPFFTTGGKGHGLGLTVARRIVTLHDGAIAVESRKGAGTVFTVSLPATDDRLPARDVPPAPSRVFSGRVLYLEDESVVAAVGGKMLAVLGFEADTCGRGEEALLLYKKAKDERRPYRFVLLDVLVAGGKGGIETVRELRRLDPALVAAATSGYNDGDIAVNFKKYGFCAFLPKPYLLADLRKMAELVLGGAEER